MHVYLRWYIVIFCGNEWENEDWMCHGTIHKNCSKIAKGASKNVNFFLNVQNIHFSDPYPFKKYLYIHCHENE